MRYLYHHGQVKMSKIVKQFPKYAPRSIYRHCKKSIEEADFDKREHNRGGRPKKLSKRDDRKLIREIYKLRKEVGPSFVALHLQNAANMFDISERTIRRILSKHEYELRTKRRKGIVTLKDYKLRRKFANKALKKFSPDLWTKGVSMYFDGVSFTHKRNALEAARCHGSKAWRKKNEGLSVTAKGKKEGTGGKSANFFVGISYNKGVVLCEQYEDHLNGEIFGEFVKAHFRGAFKSSINPKGKVVLQDGDSKQNSAKAKKAFNRVGCKIMSIPARSPDVNPIENLFNVVRVKIRQDSIDKQLTCESFEDFSARVKDIIKNFSLEYINKTIESMPKRMKLILKGKGKRIKY